MRSSGLQVGEIYFIFHFSRAALSSVSVAKKPKPAPPSNSKITGFFKKEVNQADSAVTTTAVPATSDVTSGDGGED